MRNRTTWIMTAAALVMAAGLTAMPALSQDAEQPTARQVVDRYIEALGGEKAIRAHSAMTMEGAMEMGGQGMSAVPRLTKMK